MLIPLPLGAYTPLPLAAAHPQLAGRVVHTSDGGNLGHTAFATSCAAGAPSCVPATADPGGAWTRSMIDLYLAGAADGLKWRPPSLTTAPQTPSWLL